MIGSRSSGLKSNRDAEKPGKMAQSLRASQLTSIGNAFGELKQQKTLRGAHLLDQPCHGDFELFQGFLRHRLPRGFDRLTWPIGILPR